MKREDETVTAFTMRRIREDIIDECAKAVEATTWTIPMYPRSENINVAAGEVAGIVINQAAEAVRALKTAQGKQQ